MKKLIIFDMDGVIIDSELFYKNRMYDFLKMYNSDLNVETVYETAGMGRDGCKKFIGKVTGMPENESYALYTEYKKKNYIDDYSKLINQDAIKLIKYCKNEEYLLALASNTIKKNLDKKISGCGLEGVFDYVISGDQVEKMKPDPEIYLKTAQTMNKKPNDCIVVEDSFFGIEAGKKAGMYVVARKHPKLIVDVSAADFATYDLRDFIGMIKQAIT